MVTKMGSVNSKRPVYRRQNAVVEEPPGRNLVDNKKDKQSAFAFPRIYKPRCQCFCSLCTQLNTFGWFDRPGESSPEKDCCW